MEYERSTKNAHEEEYPINIESNFPFSPNSKDYDSSTEEGEDEKYPTSQYFKSTNDGRNNFTQVGMVMNISKQ